MDEDIGRYLIRRNPPARGDGHQPGGFVCRLERTPQDTVSLPAITQAELQNALPVLSASGRGMFSPLGSLFSSRSAQHGRQRMPQRLLLHHGPVAPPEPLRLHPIRARVSVAPGADSGLQPAPGLTAEPAGVGLACASAAGH